MGLEGKVCMSGQGGNRQSGKGCVVCVEVRGGTEMRVPVKGTGKGERRDGAFGESKREVKDLPAIKREEIQV